MNFTSSVADIPIAYLRLIETETIGYIFSNYIYLNRTQYVLMIGRSSSVEIVKFSKTYWNSGPTPLPPCNNTRLFPFQDLGDLKPSPYILIAGEQEHYNRAHLRAAFISTVNEVTWPLSSLTTDSSAYGSYDLGDDVIGSTGTNLTNSCPLLPVNTNTFMQSFIP